MKSQSGHQLCSDAVTEALLGGCWLYGTHAILANNILVTWSLLFKTYIKVLVGQLRNLIPKLFFKRSYTKKRKNKIKNKKPPKCTLVSPSDHAS